jgi:membrane protease YdiL (CAAX protease family)
LDSANQIPAWLLVVGAFFVAASLFVYVRLVRRIAREGGKVPTENFAASDLAVVLMLLAWFLSAIFQGFQHAPKPVHDRDIVQGALVFIAVVFFLGSFMHFRGIRIAEQFGLRRIGFLKVAATALGLVAAAYPLVGVASVLTGKVLGEQAKSQEMVSYFLNAAQSANYKMVLATMLMGVLVAPVAEEFIFRGYIYGVLKRNVGLAGAVLLNASVFAAIHLNETSLPALFVLALCFTIAYEATGSLLVCMGMHALFNFTNFTLLLLAGNHLAP